MLVGLTAICAAKYTLAPPLHLGFQDFSIAFIDEKRSHCVALQTIDLRGKSDEQGSVRFRAIETGTSTSVDATAGCILHHTGHFAQPTCPKNAIGASADSTVFPP
jgi:hypothetical protein